MRQRGETGGARRLGALLAGVLVAGGCWGTPAEPPREHGGGEDPPAAGPDADHDAPAAHGADQDPPAAHGPDQDPPAKHEADHVPPGRADRPRASTRPARSEVVVPYRVEVRTSDARGVDFAATVHDVLTDPRGWTRAGFRFVRDPEAAYTIVLADGEEVDRLCHPYDTAATYSCQNGPVVALNVDRWGAATPEWPGTLAGYRTMLVNHEVGHLLHLHHPDPQCPGPGLPAPVMAQQSSGPEPCLPHSWPLRWETDLAAQRREPLAPPADHDVSDHRPAPPPARS